MYVLTNAYCLGAISHEVDVTQVNAEILDYGVDSVSVVLFLTPNAQPLSHQNMVPSVDRGPHHNIHNINIGYRLYLGTFIIKIFDVTM